MRRAQLWLAKLSIFVVILVAAIPGFAAAEEAISLGAAVSQTGRYALNGANTKKGYDLAIKRVNDKGGVAIGGKRYKLTIKYYDDESSPSRGSELAERLIEQDRVDFLLGPYSSGLTKAMLPIVERHGVPIVEANGVARELFTKGYRNIFAVSASGTYLGEALALAAEHAGELGKDPSQLVVALATDDDPFSQDVRTGVLENAAKQNMQVVIDDQLPPELNDMSVTLLNVKTLKPDILIVSGHERGALTAVAQLEAMKVFVPVVILTHCDSARLAQTLATESEDIFCASQWHPSLAFSDEWFGTSADFAALYRSTYGEEAPSQAAQSAAAVLVYADAFARAQSLERDKVRAALSATERDVFFGRIDFDDTGRNIAKVMLLTQLRGGKYVLVAPHHWATGDPVIPRRRR